MHYKGTRHCKTNFIFKIVILIYIDIILTFPWASRAMTKTVHVLIHHRTTICHHQSNDTHTHTKLTAYLWVATLFTFDVLGLWRERRELLSVIVPFKWGLEHFEHQVLGGTHVSARDWSSFWGCGISSSACFWRVCQRTHHSPPVPFSDIRSSSRLNPGCYHWQLAPLAYKV